MAEELAIATLLPRAAAARSTDSKEKSKSPAVPELNTPQRCPVLSRLYFFYYLL